jgi:WD40 repeat protein
LEPVLCLAWSPSGRFLAFGGADKTIRVYDLEHKVEVACLLGHANWVRSLDWAPDESSLVSGSNDGTIRVWGWPEKCEQEVRYRPGNRVEAVRYTPDARAIAACSSEATLRFWDPRELVELPITARHESYVTGVAFASSPERYATGCEDGTVRVWSLAVGASESAGDPSNHQARCTGLALSPDGSLVVTSSEDRTVRVWDLDGMERICFTGHEQGVLSATFSPDGRRVASASYDKTIRVWSLEGAAEVARLTELNPPIRTLLYGRMGQMIMAHEMFGVRIWPQDDSPAFCIPEPTARRILHFAVSSDDSILAIVTHLDPEVRVWNTEKGEWQTFVARDPSIAGHLLEIWDLEQKKLLRRIPAEEAFGGGGLFRRRPPPRFRHNLLLGSRDLQSSVVDVQAGWSGEPTTGLASKFRRRSALFG